MNFYSQIYFSKLIPFFNDHNFESSNLHFTFFLINTISTALKPIYEITRFLQSFNKQFHSTNLHDILQFLLKLQTWLYILNWIAYLNELYLPNHNLNFISTFEFWKLNFIWIVHKFTNVVPSNQCELFTSFYKFIFKLKTKSWSIYKSWITSIQICGHNKTISRTKLMLRLV